MLSDSAVDSDRQLQRARAELERCLRIGQPCHAEQLLAAFPALAADAERAVELISAEFALRRQIGEQPDPGEWYARFPRWRERLRDRLEGDGPAVAGSPSTVAEETGPAPTIETPPLDAGKGRIFGRYETLGEIGRGGMGVVYQARDTLLGRLVALKTLRGGRGASREDVERFYREARAAAQLRHEHIIEIHDIAQQGDEHYFAMEFATGGNLAHCVNRFRDDPRAAATLVEKVARAVQHAHEQGVIHRDLKPSNVLLDEEGEPLVADFGLARFVDSNVELTRTGQVLGTPAYMAPEQVSGKATAQSDVWAVGVILYELLTGRRPFLGETSTELSDQIRTAEPQRPRQLQPNLERDLETIVLKCLEKEPARRFSTAGELADELGRWLRGEPIQTRPPNWLRRAGRLVRRHPAWATAVVLLAAFAAVAAAAAPFLRTPTERPVPRDPIEFIGQDGLRQGGQWVIGQGKLTANGGGVMRLQSQGLALVELKAASPWERCRFRIEVQDLGPKSVGVGIFFNYQPKVVGGVTSDHWFYAWAFAERKGFPDPKAEKAQSQVEAYRRANRPDGLEFYEHRYAASSIGTGMLQFPPKPGAWRKLTLDVTPDAISALWGEEKFAFIIIGPDVLKDRREFLANLEPKDTAPPQPSTKGSLGVYCEKGSMLFRNAVLEPLLEGP